MSKKSNQTMKDIDTLLKRLLDTAKSTSLSPQLVQQNLEEELKSTQPDHFDALLSRAWELRLDPRQLASLADAVANILSRNTKPKNFMSFDFESVPKDQPLQSSMQFSCGYTNQLPKIQVSMNSFCCCLNSYYLEKKKKLLNNCNHLEHCLQNIL